MSWGRTNVSYYQSVRAWIVGIPTAVNRHCFYAALRAHAGAATSQRTEADRRGTIEEKDAWSEYCPAVRFFPCSLQRYFTKAE